MNTLDQKQRSAVVFPSVSIGRSGPPLPAIKWKEILFLTGYLKDCEKIPKCEKQNWEHSCHVHGFPGIFNKTIVVIEDLVSSGVYGFPYCKCPANSTEQGTYIQHKSQSTMPILIMGYNKPYKCNKPYKE